MNNLYPYPARLFSKRLSIIFALFLGFSALAGLTGCEPADLGVQLTPDEGLRTVTVGVSAEGAGTKAEIDNDLVFSWTAGDKIAVWAGSEGSGQYYTSEAYTGGNTYQIPLSGTRSNYAVYPFSIAVAEAATAGSLKVKLPAEYDFTAVGADYSPLPMVATNTEGQDLAFMHLGGLLRITLGDLPAGTAYVTVDLGKPINGIFPVHLESDGSYISCEDEDITSGSNVTKFLVPSPASGSIVLNLPVPTGSYESITVTAYDASDNSLGADSPAFSWNCERAHGKKLADNDLGWVYVFGSLSDGTVPYSGGDVTLASGFQSYRYRGETQKKVPYVVEYSLDGETWSTEAPDWLTGAPTSSTGSIEGENLALTVAPQVNSAPDPHHDVLAARTPKTGFDLSTVNVATGETVNRSTANCYVVQAPGTYKFPLVYGNGVNDGEVNESAYRAKAGVNATDYRPDDGVQYYLGRFKDHLDQNIMSPYIATQQSGKALSATLIWTDVLGLVTDVALSGSGEDSYLTFSVPAETITQGNALVAVLVDDDVDGTPETFAWSWHIWVTDEDLTVVKEGCDGALFASVNLGWCNGKTETYDSRTCQVRIVASSGGLASSSVITQTEQTLDYYDNSPYYQWGRKDPIAARDGQLGLLKKYYSPNPEFASPTDPAGFIPPHADGKVSIGQAIRHPYLFYNYGESSPFDWSLDFLLNLWNSTINGYGDSQVNTPITKTIYDPSPVGYKLPQHSAWSGFTADNFTWVPASGKTLSGRIYTPSGLFFPRAGASDNTTGQLNSPNGFYWSATPRDQRNGYAFRLHFHQSGIPWNADLQRVNGRSVRPIMDN